MGTAQLSDYIGDEVFEDYQATGGKKKRISWKGSEMEPPYWRRHMAHLVPWDKIRDLIQSSPITIQP